VRPRPRRLDGREAERLLEGLGVEAGVWPPGPSWVLADEDEPSALVRSGEPEPGEGYHREHVRLLRGTGHEHALSVLTSAVVAACDERLRLETCCPAGLDPGWAAACRTSGLELEVSLPAAWRPASGAPAVALEFWGRAGRGRRLRAPVSRTPVPSRPESGWELQVHGAATRAALATFLGRLVAGRAYPPGVLLSDAERSETRRPGDLDAEWMLALAEDGSVVAGVVLEPDGRPERAHVRRLHVDVLPEFRGLGLATQLFDAARRRAGELGVERVEADPRGGHAAVIRALEKAGLGDCGRQAGAWRMRTATLAWDEDVALLSAPT